MENAYASTRQTGFRPSRPDVIEAPAKHIHMVSEPVAAPFPVEEENDAEEQPAQENQPDPEQPVENDSADPEEKSE